ncbi:hypothetical protein RB600_005723 [Gaeumannomyces tritici]
MARLLAVALACAASHIATAAAGPTGTSTGCETPYIRKEWRTLSDLQRGQYIGAVKCMMEKPGRAPLDAVQNRFEDFLATHIVQADSVHFVGIFYPYHRLLLAEYEEELWGCGWDRGLGQPYWDWTLDTGSKESFLASPIFDDVAGFGGNGVFIPGNRSHPQLPGFIGGPPFDIPDRSGGGCLDSGPFSGLSSHLGPWNNTAKREGVPPHCVRRDLSYGSLSGMSGPAQVAAAMLEPDYGHFSVFSERDSFHPGGHWALGGLYGTMTDKYASPGDPVFYFHHSNVDRAWWSWQQRDLEKREGDISGPLVAFDYGNEVAGDATLDTLVWVGLAAEDRRELKVAELMHIQKGPFCYSYSELY